MVGTLYKYYVTFVVFTQTLYGVTKLPSVVLMSLQQNF